ncbi:MAG: hypothetical protein ACLR39_00020 [Oscillospiraceae bacterium]
MAMEMRRLLSARSAGAYAVFQRVKSYLQFITNRLPETRAHCALASALPEGWWFDIEVLTTTGKSIFPVKLLSSGVSAVGRK